MKVSVILCTYNRCQILATALNGLADQALPESDECDVLVVDNNSTDQTREVISDFCRRYPGRFRYLFEAQQGLSHARNAGIKEAMGDVLAFVDDDVTITATWLEHLVAPLRSGKYVGAGGRVLPEWTCKPPRWLSVEGRYALAPFAVFDLGPEAGRLFEPPLGANMAFRKKLFDRYGYFRTDLGRCGQGMISNEDTEFGRRLLNGGEALHYVPSAVVYHPVSKDRLRKDYFLKWWFGKGRSDIRQAGPRAGTQYSVGGIPLYLLRNLVRWVVVWMIAPGPRQRFHNKLRVWGIAGAIIECYLASRAATHKWESNAARPVAD